MSLISFQKKAISDFRGAWLVSDQTQQNASRASLAYNVRFTPGNAFTRNGIIPYKQMTADVQPITSFYGWVFTVAGVEYSRIIFIESPNLWWSYLFNDGGTVALFTRTALKGSFAEAETRLYMAGWTSAGVAAGGVKIFNTTSNNVDDGFGNPPTATYAITDTGTGVVAAGQHSFCIRVETRSGFGGRVSTSIGTGTAAGGKQIQVQVTLTVPADGAFLHLGMTTVDNQLQFFEVASRGVIGGLQTQTFVINLADEDLVVGGAYSEMTDYFSLLTQANGAPVPTKVITFGNRMVYIDNTNIFISDPYNLQWLLNPDNVIQVEGARKIVTVERIGGVLVIFGENFTFTLTGDNSTKPRTWMPPANVSNNIGTACLNGAIQSSGYQFLWVAHESGLYTFSGAYGTIPVSYMFDADWKRINWASARTRLEMIDNPKERCLYISVPLDGATECNYRMVIDYSRARIAGGVDPYLVDYSLDDYNNAASIYAIGLLQDFVTKVKEIAYGMVSWIFKRDPVNRSDQDATAAAIAQHGLYETGLNLATSESRSEITRFGGAQAQIDGNGDLQITPFGLGRAQTADDSVDAISLTAAPDGDVEARWHMESENQSIRFETTAAGAWFNLSRLKVFFKAVGSTKAS